jgi:outer membrane biosynthesis protein TonB
VGDAAAQGSCQGDSPPTSPIHHLHESTPLSKLTSVFTLALAATLLAGCGAASDEPDTRPASSESATPSASPTAEETPEPIETPSEEAPEPRPEPTEEPAPAPEQPEEPLPTIDPLPAGPNDPFVPPPHGEPNPTMPPIVIADGTTPHSDPNYFKFVGPIYPQPAGIATGSQIVSQGATLTIAGSGYAPGAVIHVLLAEPQTDYNYLTQTTVTAGPDGSYTFPISIGSTMPLGYFAIMTWTPGQADSEATKRFHNLHIIGAGS